MKIVNPSGFCENLEINGWFFSEETFLDFIREKTSGNKIIKIHKTGEKSYYNYKSFVPRGHYWSPGGNEI